MPQRAHPGGVVAGLGTISYFTPLWTKCTDVRWLTWRPFSSPTGTTMLAHHQGGLLDQSKLAGSLAISG